MGKSLYSLMLNDEVVSAVDRLAARQGLTRSAMVNMILAEYAGVLTPEKRINDIFTYIESVFGSAGDIIPQVMPNQQTMSLKSSLDYKYRPSIRYEVELSKNSKESIGRLTVFFRTQSEALLSDMIRFFRLWKRLEDLYLPKIKGKDDVEYALYDNRFTRSITLPENVNHTSGSVGEAISSYINMFDSLMKKFLSGSLSEEAVEEEYVGYLKKGVGIM